MSRMSELAIEVQNQELAYFDFDCEYQRQLEQEQVELMNAYGLQKFNELFNQEGNQPCH
nr:hypothetical protein 17 [Moraxellaceae bacterium]